MHKKRIVLFGCQQIAVDFIELLQSREDVELIYVYTYELPLDKTYGYSSVYNKCAKLNIPCEKPKKISNRIINYIKKLKPDFIFSVYYRKIFPVTLLEIPECRAINIHPSKLPKYRGPVPTAWAIKNGEKEFGITIHYMDRGIDTGDILFQKTFKIFENETGFELYTRGMTLGAKILEENIEKILYNKLHPVKQNGIGSYYGKINGKHQINWQNNFETIRNMVRIHAYPYNSAETILFNRYFFIDKVSTIKDQNYELQGPGRIVDIKPGGKLVVSCADGFLLLEDFNIFPKLKNNEKSLYFKIGNKFD
jgi:methionyl-tRNA formyltransferase